MFDSPEKLLLGLASGFVFGFLLQKGQVSKFQVIVNQFLLRDFTMAKTMLTAIVVGGLGIYALHAAGAVALHVKPALMAGVTLGGALFAVGMVVLGYCPGTGVAAMAEGSRHAVAGVAGMLIGAAAYTEAFPWIKANILTIGDYGKATAPELTATSPLLWLVGLALLGAASFAAWIRCSGSCPLAKRATR